MHKGSIKENKMKNVKKISGYIKSPNAQLGVNDIYNYIKKLLQDTKENGLKYIELTSGDIHKDLGLVQRMPSL
ncbi:hypothetical protein KM792_06220 [Clostridium tyrobutyricum]|uniref:hypothetical protein n=1 Tax=Clostridium tyrobutyricum TaxID=1519 RepID=UPI001C381DFD|nr:hypothetical protein [Clostridium tyrobutyricum]MBV4449266.1 hypothetical protein [Clostridium tyrobutyricum]